MEETQRVDIKLKKETLRIAGVEAAKLGISRRKYLSEIIERTIKKLNDIGG
jgi:predicted DNA binding CopG/RHH family protein